MAGQTLAGRSLQSSPRRSRGPGRGGVSIREQQPAESREEPERASYLPARPSSARARKTAKPVLSLPALPPRAFGSRPAHTRTHTHAPLHTRAHTRTHTHRLARIDTPARAHARSHSGCNKGRGQRCLTFLPPLFCGPLAPGRRPAHPPSTPPDGGGRLAAGAARRSGNFAPGGRETKAAALPEAARPRCAR